MEAALHALEGFKRIMDEHGASRYRAVATSAVREAENGGLLVERARREAGIERIADDAAGPEHLSQLCGRVRAERREAETGRRTIIYPTLMNLVRLAESRDVADALEEIGLLLELQAHLARGRGRGSGPRVGDAGAQRAKLGRDHGRFSFREFSLSVPTKAPGTMVVMARATSRSRCARGRSAIAAPGLRTRDATGVRATARARATATPGAARCVGSNATQSLHDRVFDRD